MGAALATGSVDADLEVVRKHLAHGAEAPHDIGLIGRFGFVDHALWIARVWLVLNRGGKSQNVMGALTVLMRILL